MIVAQAIHYYCDYSQRDTERQSSSEAEADVRVQSKQVNVGH